MNSGANAKKNPHWTHVSFFPVTSRRWLLPFSRLLFAAHQYREELALPRIP
jgi:hypothetical protein